LSDSRVNQIKTNTLSDYIIRNIDRFSHINALGIYIYDLTSKSEKINVILNVLYILNKFYTIYRRRMNLFVL